MSRGSSNVSGGTWGSSCSLPPRGRAVGVPKRCWCGERIVALNSKSDNNPHRRYFRCAYAVAEKVWGDDHAFKWVDEGIVEEINILKVRNGELEEELKVLKSERLVCEMRLENDIMEKVQLKFEDEIIERVEGRLAEAECSIKKVMVQVVIGCVVFGLCFKLVG